MPATHGGLAGSPPPVVVGRDGPTSPIKIASRFAGDKVRKLLPDSFQTMIDEDRQRHVRESLCVMYVALTRAAHAIYVIVSCGVKPNHQSAAGILLSTLCPEVELKEGVLFEHGDPHWQQKIERPAGAASDPLNLSEFYLPDDAELNVTPFASELKSMRGLPRTSPSVLEGGTQIRLASLFRSDKSDASRQRGELIHACFELVNWLDQAVPTQQQLHDHLKSVAPTVGEFATIIESFYQRIEHQTVRQLLSRDSYQESYLMHSPPSDSIMLEANRVEVETERPFAVQLDDGILQGVIDRLVLIYEGDLLVAADVIDFKTDVVGVGEIAPRIAYYKPQLAAYRAAVAKFTRLPLENVSTRLLFVESGQLVNLDFVESAAGRYRQPVEEAEALASRRQKSVSSALAKNGAIKKKSTPKKKRGQSGQQKLWDD
jgi:ATP-dependent exoDNAse (exonuclease V) beta subunit